MHTENMIWDQRAKAAVTWAVVVKGKEWLYTQNYWLIKNKGVM